MDKSPGPVALLVRAWIEVRHAWQKKELISKSLPSQEFGLKSICSKAMVKTLVVPIVGAWIEVGDNQKKTHQVVVAPSRELGLKSESSTR